MIASDGDSRRSSVRALNVRPQHADRLAGDVAAGGRRRSSRSTRSNCSSLTAMTPSSRSNVVAGVVGDLQQRPRVLREATATPARAGAEEVLADALVVAEAEHDVVDVGADALADRGDGVDERELGGEEGVGGVLDRLRRRRVGDDHRRGDAEVQRRHLDRRRLVGAADDDAVGLQEVLHGRALAEELGVRHDLHVGPVEHPLDDAGRADRHRRLVDDDALVRQVRRRSPAPPPRCRRGRRCRPRPAASARTGTRCRSPSTAFAAPSTKRSRPGAQALLDEPVEAVLDDRDLAPATAGRPCRRRRRRRRPRGRGGRSRRRSSARRSPCRRWRSATCAEPTGRHRPDRGHPAATGRSLPWRGCCRAAAAPPRRPGPDRRVRRRARARSARGSGTRTDNETLAKLADWFIGRPLTGSVILARRLDRRPHRPAAGPQGGRTASSLDRPRRRRRGRCRRVGVGAVGGRRSTIPAGRPGPRRSPTVVASTVDRARSG